MTICSINAFDNSSDIIFYTDKQGAFTYINKAFTHFYGYTENEVLFKATPQILNSGIHNESFFKLFWDNLSQENSVSGVHFINKHKNGNLVDVEVSANSILDEKGVVIGFLCIQRDIADRLNKERVKKVLLNIGNGIQTESNLKETMLSIQKALGKVVDTKNFYIAIYNEENETFKLPLFQDEKDNITEFPAKKTLTGLLVSKEKSLLLYEKDMIKLHEEDIIDSIGENSKVWLGIPLKINGKINGAFVVQNYDNENAYGEKDRGILEIVSHQISIFLDIKYRDLKLFEAIENSKKSDRLKSAFLANISHEIRTPLNSILGFSDLLKADNLTNEQKSRYINTIEKSGIRLLNTINDILDISKIKAGIKLLNISEININNLLKEIYEELEPMATKKGLKFSFIKNTINEPYLYSDEEKVFKILLKLVRNAIKFTDKGNVYVGYKKKESCFVFFVIDTGIGIPLNKQRIIFKRFIQVNIEDKESREGTGLGLAIVKSFIKLLGGKIKFRSSEGFGSSFYVFIPNYGNIQQKKDEF